MTAIGVFAMQVASGLSMLFALAIMVTILRLNLFRKLFLKLVFYVALSDFFAGASTVVGGTRTGSVACYIQGLVSNYFTLSSIFWTATIGYEVHLVVWKNKVENNITYFALFNWIWPLVLSLVPLSTSIYGNDDEVPGWCFLDIDPRYPQWLKLFWFIVSFYFWIYLGVIYLLYVVISVYYKLLILQRGKTTDANVVVERIIYYPLIVILCWGVTSIIDLGLRLSLHLTIDPNKPFTVIFSYLLPNSQGFWSAIVFFSVNGDLSKELTLPGKSNRNTMVINASMSNNPNGPRSMSTASEVSQVSAAPGLSMAPMSKADIYNDEEVGQRSVSNVSNAGIPGLARGHGAASTIIRESYRHSQQITTPIGGASRPTSSRLPHSGSNGDLKGIDNSVEGVGATSGHGVSALTGIIKGVSSVDEEEEINGPLPDTEGPLISDDDYYTHHIPVMEPSISQQYGGMFMMNPLHDAFGRDSDGMSMRDSTGYSLTSFSTNNNNTVVMNGSRGASGRYDDHDGGDGYGHDGNPSLSTSLVPIPIGPGPVSISHATNGRSQPTTTNRVGSVDSIATSLTAMELERHDSNTSQAATTPHGTLIYGRRRQSNEGRAVSIFGRRTESRAYSVSGPGGEGTGRERAMSNFFSNVFGGGTPSSSYQDTETVTAYHTANSLLSADAL